MQRLQMEICTIRFNDYPEREYTQASGNGEYLVRDKDIVLSVW